MNRCEPQCSGPITTGFPFRRLWMPVFLLALLQAGCERGPSNTGDSPKLAHALISMAGDIQSVMTATENQTALLAAEISSLYPALAENASKADASHYRLESNGVLHRPGAVKSGQPAVFVSGAVKVSGEIMGVVLGTEAIDPILKRIPAENPAVAQVYYNDRNSYNRIYPPFDVLIQYPAGMNIPSYNFYYQADERHNPNGKAVWIKDPYVDPAGRGWMVSCVAPVRHNRALEGVCGLDITVEAIVRSFDFEGRNKLCLLASSDGTVVAAGELMIRILRLPALKNHRYVDTVRSNTFRSADFNMLKSRSLAIREMAGELLSKREPSASLELDDEHWTVHAVTIPGLDWRLMDFTIRK